MGGYNRAVQSYRLFIAVDLPADVRRALGRLAADLDKQLPRASVRWVAPAAMHLTLAFLGDWPVVQLAAVEAQLDALAARHAPIALRLGGAGCFPNADRPRVIWVGLNAAPPAQRALAALKRDLDAGLQTLGWKADERPFQPHLTLGRVKSALPPRALPAQIDVPALALPVGALHLMCSELQPAGPRYSVLHSVTLA